MIHLVSAVASGQKRTLTLMLLLVTSAASAQILAGKGTVITKGSVTVGPQSSQYVRIFVVFPPETDPDRSDHFAPYVMKASAIDGVTESIVWSAIETYAPSSTSCPVGAPGTDQCQIDASGWYHGYNWASTDSRLAYWFSSGNGWGTKMVNIVASAQTAPVSPNNVNSATPYYVTTPSWIAHTGGAQNYINANEYSCTSWKGPTIHSISTTGNDATVTLDSPLVTQANGYPPTGSLTANDVVWIAGTGSSGLDTGATPAAITQIDSTTVFHFHTNCSTNCNASQGTAITSVQSWLVPYQTPMKTALKAFYAAAMQHFGRNTSDPTNIKPAQVYYMRLGKSVGGESFVYCTGNLPDYPPGTPYSSTTWQNYITEMTDFEQAQSPTMLIFEPINRVGSSSSDSQYPDYEASDAVKHGNLYGATFGFGSQGLSLNDFISAPPCASNWCTNFNNNFPRGSPLELQQIANSDPTDQTCVSGCNPGGDSGDLRNWLPAAVSGHLNVLELYSVDADLAFDPQFCVLSGGMCGSGSYTSLNGLSSAQQLKYFQPDAGPPAPDKSGVGLGNYHSCYTGTGLQGSAQGDCSYRDAINSAHGYH